MYCPPSKEEMQGRMQLLFQALDAAGDWDMAFFVDKVNQFYWTGTMQDGVLALEKGGRFAYFARTSLERARLEALVDEVFPMKSYREVREKFPGQCRRAFVETEALTVGALERLRKYFGPFEVLPAGPVTGSLRAVKSPYEMAILRACGEKHRVLLEEKIPPLLTEGMTEAELGARVYGEMLGLGAQGFSRFVRFQTESLFGQWGFGDSSLYPTSFDGPGGMRGQSPASPGMGSGERRLQKGDLVFMDVGFGLHGYHTDRTQVYLFGGQPPEEARKAHAECLRIQRLAASLLRPGNIPSQIYQDVLATVDPAFLPNFMGFGSKTVTFLGHGVGLQIDETPVIAKGFDKPLQKDMVIALEPKKGIPGFGMVGVEDTYLVTENGGECITGGEKGILAV